MAGGKETSSLTPQIISHCLTPNKERKLDKKVDWPGGRV